MKLKKVVSALLVGTMVFGLTACGESAATPAADTAAETTAEDASVKDSAVTGNADASEKLVIWTLAKDLESFAERYAEQNPDVQVETVVIEPADYVTKVQTALNGGATEPDIIVGEPQMLEDMFDAGYFEDLNQAPYNAQITYGKLVRIKTVSREQSLIRLLQLVSTTEETSLLKYLVLMIQTK